MTLPIYKHTEALYTIIVKDAQAQNNLKKWTQSSRNIQARVEENRMSIYDHNTLCMFVISWIHGFDNVMIWDPWLKRHIYF